MVIYVLGYPKNQWVDEVVLVFLSIFSIGHKPSVIFNYKQHLSTIIHDQFLKFKVEGAFKHE